MYVIFFQKFSIAAYIRGMSEKVTPVVCFFFLPHSKPFIQWESVIFCNDEQYWIECFLHIKQATFTFRWVNVFSSIMRSNNNNLAEYLYFCWTNKMFWAKLNCALYTQHIYRIKNIFSGVVIHMCNKFYPCWTIPSAPLFLLYSYNKSPFYSKQ